MANVQPWTRADGEIGQKGHLNTSGMFGNFNTDGFCFLLSGFKFRINPKYQIMHHYISPLMILSITVDGKLLMNYIVYQKGVLYLIADEITC